MLAKFGKRIQPPWDIRIVLFLTFMLSAITGSVTMPYLGLVTLQVMESSLGLFLLLDVLINMVEFLVYEYLLRKMQSALKFIRDKHPHWQYAAQRLVRYKRTFLLVYYPWMMFLTAILMLSTLLLGQVNYKIYDVIRITIGGVAYATFSFTPSFFILNKLLDRWFGATVLELYQNDETIAEKGSLTAMSIQERFFIPFTLGSASLVILVVMSLVRSIRLEQVGLITSFILFFWIALYFYHGNTHPTITNILTQTRALVLSKTVSKDLVTTDSLDEIGELVFLNNKLTHRIRASSEAAIIIARDLSALVEQYSGSFESLQHITHEISSAVSALSESTVAIADSVNEVTTSFATLQQHLHKYRQDVIMFSRELHDLMLTLRILSLNAHIEASRAGDARSKDNPRSFTVIAEMVHDITRQVAGLNKGLQSSLNTFQKYIYDHANKNIQRLEGVSQGITDFSSQFEEAAASVEEETAIISRLQDDLQVVLDVSERLYEELALLRL